MARCTLPCLARRPRPAALAWALLGAALLAILPARGHGVCAPAAASASWSPPAVALGSGETTTFEALLAQLRSRRVVFVGEAHDRYDHHLNQLELICSLAEDGRPMAIAMEFFQQPFQAALDRFTNHHQDLDRLLRESEYFQRWGFDPRLYAPILEFAARRRIPLIALNPAAETVSRVSRGGPEGLSGDGAERLRELVRQAPAAYRARLRAAFASHPGHETRDFERFLAVQVLWDERMATRASRYLSAHPGHRLVVLAGGGHVEFGDAVPGRLSGVAAQDTAIVSQTRERVEPSAGASFVLRSTAVQLPEPGRLGVLMDDEGESVRVRGFSPVSAGRDAGLKEKDRVLVIDGRTIDDMATLRLALWRKRPGDLVDLVFRRDALTASMRFALR